MRKEDAPWVEGEEVLRMLLTYSGTSNWRLKFLDRKWLIG